MKISPKILSIPPYISTSWKNIASLHLEDQESIDVLIVTLHSGVRIEIPNLEASLIKTIFTMHIHYLEMEEKTATNRSVPKTPFSLPVGNAGHFALEFLALDTPPSSTAFNGINALEHDPAQSSLPKLPEDILNKVGQIAQSMGIDDPDVFPQPETDCNCMRCQIARAIRSALKPQESREEEKEEVVSDEELSFSSWNVLKKDSLLYVVTNPLESSEQYQVHLGSPIGCTCGQDHCEHIRAVLNT